jgi:hypothetical protein
MRAIKQCIRQCASSLANVLLDDPQVIAHSALLDKATMASLLDSNCDALIDLFYVRRVPHDLVSFMFLSNTARRGYVHHLELAKSNGMDLTANDDFALVLASKHGHATAVEYLLRNGANVKSRNNQALMESVRHGHIECTRVLIRFGADITPAVFEAATPSLITTPPIDDDDDDPFMAELSDLFKSDF